MRQVSWVPKALLLSAALLAGCDSSENIYMASDSQAASNSQPEQEVALPSSGDSGSNQPAQPEATPAGSSEPNTEVANQIETDTFYFAKVRMSDGVELDVTVYSPDSPGPHPVVIMPGPWAVGNTVYATPAHQWSQDGYIVVTYTARGFFFSGGYPDFGGPNSVRDVSEIIDWTLINTAADPERIGAGGLSYGAMLAILASGKDARIKAIFAFSGVPQLKGCVYPNSTISVDGISLIDVPMDENDQDITAFIDDLANDLVNDSVATRLSKPRSAIDQIDALNMNQPAILQTAAWHDSFCNVRQHIALYQAYNGPKALDINDGDHVNFELGGLIGLPNANWARAKEWLDYYVKKSGAFLDKQPLNWVIPNNDRVLSAESVDQIFAQKNITFNLSPVPDDSGDIWSFFTDEVSGELSTGYALPDWSETLKGGIKTGAQTGVINYSGYLQAFDIEVTSHIDSIDRDGAAVWQAQEQSERLTVAGAPLLDVLVSSSSPKFSVMAYLYDQPPKGKAELITYGTYSVRDVLPGQQQQLSFELFPMLWDVEEGHKLVLVLDTFDDRFKLETKPGDEITFASSAVHPSRLVLPTQ